jgi:hypothetical protein
MLTTMARETLLRSPLIGNHKIQGLEKQTNYDLGEHMNRAPNSSNWSMSSQFLKAS